MKLFYRSAPTISFSYGKWRCCWWRRMRSTLSVPLTRFVILASCCAFIAAVERSKKNCARFRPLTTKPWKSAVASTVYRSSSKKWRAGGFCYHFFSFWINLLNWIEILIDVWFVAGCHQLYTRKRRICTLVWAILAFRCACWNVWKESKLATLAVISTINTHNWILTEMFS